VSLRYRVVDSVSIVGGLYTEVTKNTINELEAFLDEALVVMQSGSWGTLLPLLGLPDSECNEIGRERAKQTIDHLASRCEFKRSGTSLELSLRGDILTFISTAPLL
jgi:hypothetical protein